MEWENYQLEIGQNPEYQKAADDLKLVFAFGDAILRARLDKGWSQTELARRVGTKQANISRIETGLGNPTLSLVDKICNALQIELRFHSLLNENLTSQLYQQSPTNLILSVADRPETSYQAPGANNNQTPD